MIDNSTVVIGYVTKEHMIFELNAGEIVYFVKGIEDGTITYETTCAIDLFYIFNLRSRKSFDILKMLIRHSDIPITLESIQNHPLTGESLVTTTYSKWFENWRTQAIHSSYDWRIAMEKFSDIRLPDVYNYLNHMLDVFCFTYDYTIEGDRDRAMNEIDRAQTFEREAELINATGMIETEVRNGMIRILKR